MKPTGPAQAWLAAAGALAVAVLYLGLIVSEGGAHPGEGAAVALVAGALIGAAIACAVAAQTRRRSVAMMLLVVAIVVMGVLGVLAILSVGVTFLVVAAIAAIALVRIVVDTPARQWPHRTPPQS